MSQIQTPAELHTYRSKPIKKISFEAAILERDYYRYQQKQKNNRFRIKLAFLVLIVLIISVLNAGMMGLYFTNILNRESQNCKYSTYSTKWDFLPKCELCLPNFKLIQGQCYKQ